MSVITEESLANIEFRLYWNSKGADHEERFYKTVNISRDILPPGVTDRLIQMAEEAMENPDRRELDVLLATGEQTTASLLALTLMRELSGF